MVYENLTNSFNCSCSGTKSRPILWDPIGYNNPGSSVLHYLPVFAQIHVHWVGDAIQPLHPLLPCSLFAFNVNSRLNQGDIFLSLPIHRYRSHVCACIDTIKNLKEQYLTSSRLLSLEVLPSSMICFLYLPSNTILGCLCSNHAEYHWFLKMPWFSAFLLWWQCFSLPATIPHIENTTRIISQEISQHCGLWKFD